ncbi:MAG: hypothetical protein OXH65_07585 [Paracoccaceae bacterium]|nr:hypothetical protein [Paracoccaceae bacterium]
MVDPKQAPWFFRSYMNAWKAYQAAEESHEIAEEIASNAFKKLSISLEIAKTWRSWEDAGDSLGSNNYYDNQYNFWRDAWMDSCGKIG